MLIRSLDAFVESAAKYDAIGVVVQSIDTGDEIAVTFDLEIVVNEYGDLLLYIQI